MFRNKAVVFLICFCTVLGTVSLGMSQDADTATEDNVNAATDNNDTTLAEDTRADQGEVRLTESPAERAKTYFDGVNTFVNSKVQFRLKTSDNFIADKIMYKIDEDAEQEYSAEFTIAEEGKHSIAYYGVDKIGNTEETKVFNVVVDNTAPSIVVLYKNPISLINGMYYTSKVNTFSVEAKDELSGVNSVKYTIDGQKYVDYSTMFNINADQEINLGFKALDNVANVQEAFTIKLPNENGELVDSNVASLKFYVDNIAPVVEIKSDKDLMVEEGKNVASKDYVYTVAATDADSGVKAIMVRVDGKGDYVTYEKEIVFTSNGEHFIEAKAVDAVGNVSETVILSVFVDVIPPKSTIETVNE